MTVRGRWALRSVSAPVCTVVSVPSQRSRVAQPADLVTVATLWRATVCQRPRAVACRRRTTWAEPARQEPNDAPARTAWIGAPAFAWRILNIPAENAARWERRPTTPVIATV